MYLVECPRHFTDLVYGVHIDRIDLDTGGRVVGLAHPPDRLGQPDPGDLQGAGAQPLQRADH